MRNDTDSFNTALFQRKRVFASITITIFLIVTEVLVAKIASKFIITMMLS
jgi:hypothetical protein